MTDIRTAAERGIPLPRFVLRGDWTPDQLREARANLLTRIAMTQHAMESIVAQLQRAASRAEDGELVDPEWWQRANSALKHNRRERDEFRAQLAEIDRRIGQFEVSR